MLQKTVHTGRRRRGSVAKRELVRAVLRQSSGGRRGEVQGPGRGQWEKEVAGNVARVQRRSPPSERQGGGSFPSIHILRPALQRNRGLGPRNVDAQADLSRTLYSQGLAALRTGDKAAATRYFQAALDIRRRRVNLSSETYAQKDLMVTLAHAGSHREAVQLAVSLREKLPKDPGTLVDIANCYALLRCSVGAGMIENA